MVLAHATNDVAALKMHQPVGQVEDALAFADALLELLLRLVQRKQFLKRHINYLSRLSQKCRVVRGMRLHVYVGFELFEFLAGTRTAHVDASRLNKIYNRYIVSLIMHVRERPVYRARLIVIMCQLIWTVRLH